MEIMEAHDILEKVNTRLLFKNGKKDFPRLFRRLFSFTSNGHRLPEQHYVHGTVAKAVGKNSASWLEKTLKAAVTKLIRGPVRNN